jgi:hydroxymethylbilane synthase
VSATVRIATRGSALALWQANWVRAQLAAAEPGLVVELVVLKTRGDKIVDRALSEVGGKGLFVKEIEEALLDGRAEIAVHSMKDLPSDVPAELVIAAVPAREDARDALVVAPAHARVRGVEELPRGARVGTSSLRRVCQLKARRGDLEVVPLRGNVDTRLGKLAAGELDAAVLACAGLIRLGHAERIAARLSTAESVPAIGQGALAIECRGDDAKTRARLLPLDDRATALAVAAERAFLARLQGDCKTPLAAHATIDTGGGGSSASSTAESSWRLHLDGLVGAPDGSAILRESLDGTATDGASLGRALAEKLLARGAERLLSAHAIDPVGGA